MCPYALWYIAEYANCAHSHSCYRSSTDCRALVAVCISVCADTSGALSIATFHPANDSSMVSVTVFAILSGNPRRGICCLDWRSTAYPVR